MRRWCHGFRRWSPCGSTAVRRRVRQHHRQKGSSCPSSSTPEGDWKGGGRGEGRWAEDGKQTTNDTGGEEVHHASTDLFHKTEPRVTRAQHTDNAAKRENTENSTQRWRTTVSSCQNELRKARTITAGDGSRKKRVYPTDCPLCSVLLHSTFPPLEQVLACARIRLLLIVGVCSRANGPGRGCQGARRR